MMFADESKSSLQIDDLRQLCVLSPHHGWTTNGTTESLREERVNIFCSKSTQVS